MFINRYFCDVKLYKTSFFLTFILISALCCKVIGAGNISRLTSTYSQEKQQGVGFLGKVGINIYSSENNESELDQSVSTECFFIKTSSQSSVTFRAEERHFLDALFKSYFSFYRSSDSWRVDRNDVSVSFASHKLKLIYPHHYFW